MSSDDELEIPDIDHDLSDSEGESKQENNEMHKIETPTKKGTICLQLYDSNFSSSDSDSESDEMKTKIAMKIVIIKGKAKNQTEEERCQLKQKFRKVSKGMWLF